MKRAIKSVVGGINYKAAAVACVVGALIPGWSGLAIGLGVYFAWGLASESVAE